MRIIPDAKNKDSIISILLFIIIILSFCLLFMAVDVRVTNQICLQRLEEQNERYQEILVNEGVLAPKEDENGKEELWQESK